MPNSFSEMRQAAELRLDPKQTVIVVVDMLNDFLCEGGAMPLLSGRRCIEPNRRLLEAARAARVPVVYANDTHFPNDREFEKRVVHCLKGTWGAQVVDELTPTKADYVVEKRRYSGFYQTHLDLLLRDLGAKHVVVTGVVTNICVRSTVHDAFFLGYDVVVPEECVGGTSDRDHEASLYDIDTHYGTVASIEGVLQLLAGAEVR